MHREAIHVRDHQERRVLQVVSVELQLRVGGGQILVRPLVLPGEAPAQEHVREALLLAPLGAGSRERPLLYAPLEGKPLARLVRLPRRGCPDQRAHVEEVLLGGRALLELVVRPLRRKLLRRHAGFPEPEAVAVVSCARAHARPALLGASTPSLPRMSNAVATVRAATSLPVISPFQTRVPHGPTLITIRREVLLGDLLNGFWHGERNGCYILDHTGRTRPIALGCLNPVPSGQLHRLQVVD